MAIKFLSRISTPILWLAILHAELTCSEKFNLESIVTPKSLRVFTAFTKYTFTAVHTKTHKRRFQIYPLWRAFSNLCVYGERFHRLRVDGRPKRIKKFAFTSVCVYNRLRADGA